LGYNSLAPTTPQNLTDYELWEFEMPRLIALVLTLACVGCSQAVDVRQDYDVDAPFSSYKTYAWVHPYVASGESRDWEEMLRLALTNELNAKGLTHAAGEPDVWVDYQLGLATNEYTVDWNKHSLESAKNSDVYMSSGGVLVVDVLDAKKDRLVWRGIAEGAVNVDPSEDIMRRNINNAVKKLMKQYPPGM
jgi:hypothetical protein